MDRDQARIGVGAQDTGDTPEKWGESLGPHCSGRGWRSAEFHGLGHIGRSSLTLGKVDQQDGGAGNQGEVGHVPP